jgi:hypothetical protein
MNVVKFQNFKKPIVFCIVDNTHIYTSEWSKELIKNISDFTISNTFSKGYDILQGQDEDLLLNIACDQKYQAAVIFSTGTEFINGDSFYNEIEKLHKEKVFIAGHILDRGDAYYELHHQCYYIDLNIYQQLGSPRIGKQQLGVRHRKTKPRRSNDNIHDEYTPTWVSSGEDETDYNHKMHGHNILNVAFDRDIPVVVFDNNTRQHKKHYYPENQQEFINHIQWAYQRFNYCSTEFVHTDHTENVNFQNQVFEQFFVPASGTWWQSMINTSKPVTVVLYDYNQKALDYWEIHKPKISNVTYVFLKIDLLTDTYDFDHFNKELPTLINLSNVYAYEATSFLYSLEQRLFKENKMIENIKNYFSSATINFSLRASTGFVNSDLYHDIATIDINNLAKPTWHCRDWL